MASRLSNELLRGLGQRQYGALALAVVLTSALELRAAEPQAPVPGDAGAQADALIAAGVALRRQGREQEALSRFREAYRLHKSPRALGQMGLAAKSLRLYVESARYLDGALAAGVDPWVEKNRAALETARGVVQKQVASIHVSVDVPRATLSVNGAEVGILPAADPIRVRAGAARIAVSADGYRTFVLQRTLVAGAVTQLHVELVPSPPAPPPRVEPKLAQAPAPLPRQASPPGATREASGSGLHPIGTIVAGGVGVAGLAVGTVFGLRTLDLKGQRDDVCPTSRCESQRGVDLDDDARAAAQLSTIGFSVAAIGIGTAAVLWLTAPDPPSGPGVSMTITPRAGFATLRWRP